MHSKTAQHLYICNNSLKKDPNSIMEYLKEKLKTDEDEIIKYIISDIYGKHGNNYRRKYLKRISR